MKIISATQDASGHIYYVECYGEGGNDGINEVVGW